MYDAEVYATHRDLRALDERGDDGRSYTIFSDSSAAIDRIGSDRMSPGQRWAVAARGVCGRIINRGSEVTARWTLARQGVEGNDHADTWAMAAAESRFYLSDQNRAYLQEVSLSHGKNSDRGRAPGHGGLDLEAREG